jgi:hypothetical protein
MRKLAALLCSLFVAGLLLAPASPAFAGAKTHQLKATVVSIDLEGKSITVTDEKGEQKTAPVLGKAVDSLKTLKAGDKVTLTCSDKDTGEHEGVSKIEVAKTS